MLTWDISYPDTFKCNLLGVTEVEIKFTIVKLFKNNTYKYNIYAKAKVGDEVFDKNMNLDFDTLQEANKECEEIYKRIKKREIWR